MSIQINHTVPEESILPGASTPPKVTLGQTHANTAIVGAATPPQRILGAQEAARQIVGATQMPQLPQQALISDAERAQIIAQYAQKGTLRRPIGLVNGTTGKVHYYPAGGVGGVSGSGAAPVAGYKPLVYGGGRTLSDVELVPFFWGNFAAADIASMQNYLQGLAGYLSGIGAPAGQAPTIWQYNCMCAHVRWAYAANDVPAGTQNDASLRARIAQEQAQGHLPAYAPNRLIMVFTHGITWDKYGVAGGWCAYHSDVADGQYYALCPQPTATSLCSSNDNRAWQSVTSHEILEAMTDPVVGTGWVDSAFAEGGDPPNFATENLPFGAVQQFDDNGQSNYSVFTPSIPRFNVRPFSPWSSYSRSN